MRPERDGRVPVRQRAVFSVPHQRQTVRGELGADLVRPSGPQRDAQKRKAVRAAQKRIVRYRLPGVLSRRVGDIGPALASVPAKQVGEAALRARRHAVGHGEIGLAEAPVHDLTPKVGRGLLRPGEKQQPAHDAVQPVDGENRRGAVAQRLAQQLRRAAGLVRAQHAGGLDAYGDTVVLIQYFHTFVSYHNRPALSRITEAYRAAGRHISYSSGRLEKQR